MEVAALFRYPVKGLSAEPLASAELQTKGFFPCDRAFAFENGRSSFVPSAPAFQPKTRFLMLMKNARLAKLESRYDDATHRLTLRLDGKVMAEGDVREEAGRRALETWLEEFCDGETRGPIRLLAAPEGFRFTDSIRSGFVSVLNLESVRDLEGLLGRRINPQRFRANIHVDGLEAWSEDRLVGRTISGETLRLKVLKTIDRCPATHVDPESGLRDLDIMETLKSAFGHIACGIYVSVLQGGMVHRGDNLRVED